MRPATLIAGGVAGALLVAGVSTDGGRAQQPQPDPGARTIQLVARHTGGFRVDNRPRGASPGDLLGFRERLTAAGRPAGRGHGTCIAVSRKLADCSVTAVLADGTLIGRFTQDATERTVTAAVVGGTGAYAGSRGTASWRSAGAATASCSSSSSSHGVTAVWDDGREAMR